MDRQYNDQKKKDKQWSTKLLQDWATPTPLKTGSEHMLEGSAVSASLLV